MSARAGVWTFRLFAAPRAHGESGRPTRAAGDTGAPGQPREPAPAATDPVAERRTGSLSPIEGRPQAEVLAQLRAGDVEALAAIYRTYIEALSRLGYSLTRSREATEDLIHDLFLAVWERHEQLDVREDLGVYLRSALRHRAYKAGRHAAVVRRMEDAALQGGHTVPGMGSVVESAAALEGSELERAFTKMLATISERDRRILTMRWEERLTHEEIARVLGISRARVRAILARNQERLRPFFDL